MVCSYDGMLEKFVAMLGNTLGFVNFTDGLATRPGDCTGLLSDTFKPKSSIENVGIVEFCIVGANVGKTPKMSLADPSETDFIRVFKEAMGSIGLPAAIDPATDPDTIAEADATTATATIVIVPILAAPAAVATTVAPVPIDTLAC